MFLVVIFYYKAFLNNLTKIGGQENVFLRSGGNNEQVLICFSLSLIRIFARS